VNPAAAARLQTSRHIAQCTLFDYAGFAMKQPKSLIEEDTEEGRLTFAALAEAVENQIRDHTPPATRATLERLIALGESRDNALRYLTCALVVEVFEMRRNEEPFNAARYGELLDALPALPYDESEL
jgi:hypothetical protein